MGMQNYDYAYDKERVKLVDQNKRQDLKDDDI